jgi:SH3-like domain-containing protein
MFRIFSLCLAALMASSAQADLPKVPQNAVGPVSNLPLPRYVSLKRDKVNMRRGPGPDHPIIEVYQRRNLPVEVLNEFDHWRKVRDPAGEEGWMTDVMLAGEPRYAMVMAKNGKPPGKPPAGAASKDAGWPVRRAPDVKARTIAIAMPGVIAELRHCPQSWCEIKAGNRTGWIERAALWGVYPGEVIR